MKWSSPRYLTKDLFSSEPAVHSGFQGPGPVHMGSEGPVKAGIGVGVLPYPSGEAQAGIVPAAIVVTGHIHAPGPIPSSHILVP